MSAPAELARFARVSSGVSSLEYAIVVALIAIAVSAGLAVVGDEIRSVIDGHRGAIACDCRLGWRVVT